MKKAYFACGCFWCSEAIFKKIRGVAKVTSGFSGGDKESSYEEVSTGTTGHAEAIEVEYDPTKITYKDLLYIFFRTHDPTTKDKQGQDVGHQYRSVIFYQGENEKKLAQQEKDSVQKDHKNEVVTQIVPFKAFYKADKSHQEYYEKRKDSAYCRLVIDPKIKKLEKNFKEYL